MIYLIAGGARSGKSSYALSTAEGIDGRHVFVATATADDGAMQQRIERHQSERSDSWELIEEPLNLAAVVERHGAGDVLLIDCLTLWVTNWLCAKNSAEWPIAKANFLEAIANTRASIIMVTNEVGLGVIPMGELSRDFVDESGWLHQEVAAIADAVSVVIFGLPQKLK